MSYTLDNLNEALAALNRGDYDETRSRLKYLIQRMERILYESKHFKPVEIDQEIDYGDHGSTESEPIQASGE